MLKDIQIASGYALDLLAYPMIREFGEPDYVFLDRVLVEKHGVKVLRNIKAISISPVEGGGLSVMYSYDK